MNEWWRNPQRIVQTNLRQIDAALDPEEVARQLDDFGATAMLFNIGGIFAWYPTELPLQAPNPKLDQESALLKRMIDAAHARDIRVIGRYDLSKGTRVAYNAHANWFCHDSAGRPFEYNGTYQACVNGDWYQKQGIAVLRESLSQFQIDGLFFNMFGYLGADYSFRPYGLCRCGNCQQAFRDFAGAELPDKRDPLDPVYRTYLRFQQVTSKALQSKIYETVKSLRPDVAVSNMGRRSDFFRGEVNRRLDRPQPEWHLSSGEQARNFRSLGNNEIRYSSALTHFIDFPWRYSGETAAGQALRLAQQLANGADPHYYFMGPPVQADRKALPAVREIFAHFARHEDTYRDLQSEARIALYTSHKSRWYEAAPGASVKAFRGAYTALLDSGLTFDTIHDERAEEPDFAEQHARYDTIVLAGCTCIGDDEAAALDAWVQAGGTLLAIGAVGTCDAWGTPRQGGPALASLPFTAVTATRETRGGYVRLDAPLDGLDSDLVMLDGPYLEIAAKPDATAEHEMLAPQRFGPPELCFDEDAPDTGLPGLLTAPAGAGRAIHVPWEADTLYGLLGLAEHRETIAALAARHTRTPAVSLSRAGRLELTVQRQATSGDLLVHVVNYSGQHGNVFDEPIRMHGLKLLLQGIDNSRVRALVAGEDLAVGPETDGRREILLPPVGYFEAIAISSGGG